MNALDRVASYLCLQLVSAGYYCLEPGHLPATVLVAGRNDEGFVLLVEDEADAQAPLPAPAQLRFLQLPVRRARVRAVKASQAGRAKLEVLLDADLLAQLPVSKPGEFGILLQPAG